MCLLQITLRLIQIRKSPEVKLIIVNMVINVAFLLVLCSTRKLQCLFFPFFLRRKGVWGDCFIIISLTLLPDSSLKTDKNAT